MVLVFHECAVDFLALFCHAHSWYLEMVVLCLHVGGNVVMRGDESSINLELF